LDKPPIMETVKPMVEWLVSMGYCFAVSARWAVMVLNNKTVARVALSKRFLLLPLNLNTAQ
jgi:hypothetical protein